MPANDSAALIVARFLKANNYTESYEAFIEEAGLSDDAGNVSSTTLTLERLLEEKKLFDQSVNFEKLDLDGKDDEGWALPAPSRAAVIDTLPGRSNVLNVVVSTVGEHQETQLIASTSDRRINLVQLPTLTLKASWSGVQDAPTLSQLVLRGILHVSSSMSGSIVLADVKSGEVIDKRKDHDKYIVGLAFYEDADTPLLASAGWDSAINIYTIKLEGNNSSLGKPLARIALPTKPESILFTKHPITAHPVLVIARTDSSHLYFWSVEKEPVLLGRQNLAPLSNSWIAFTPTSIALCPTDNTIVAVATNSTPHMKLIIVKLLFPSDQAAATPRMPRDRGLAEQAVADREQEAIRLHCNTMSAQTPYSTPLVVWRPNGKGVWVNSDEGTIRGIDVLSGKVVCELREHDNGSKVRTLWAGNVSESGVELEKLVSGGFDHKLILWSL